MDAKILHSGIAAGSPSALLGLGLIGAGGFGRFCLDQYRGVEDVRAVAVADVADVAAAAAAEEFGISHVSTPEELIRRKEVDIIHIATPPSTHMQLAVAALNAGKHVLTEKPLATGLEDGRAMLEAASANQRVLGVNLIMRYNPLCQCARKILEQGLLGPPIHAFHENYASDDTLPPEHWFWDPKKSGGVFIEHVVHFFDLFEMFFGEGEVVSAQEGVRPGGTGAAEVIEQVQCAVRYGDGVLANFYHGFHQCGQLDRQEIRIVCERGDIRLFGWVPTSLVVNAIVSTDEREMLEDLIPNVETTTVEMLGNEHTITNRHGTHEVDGVFRLRSDLGMKKQEVYGFVLRELLKDQIASIRDPAHIRRVDQGNGYRSLAMAVAADRKARQSRLEPER
jgi:predicted dehydrogenase